MHWFMALMLAVYLVQGMARSGSLGLLWMSVTMAILLVTILIHELCHCWAAISLGGSANQILFWPLGGLSFVDYPATPRNNIVVSGAGPLSNFVMAAACVPLLLATGGRWEWGLLNPFLDWYPVGYTLAQHFIIHAIRINIILALFNLVVPAYPLDGGQILMSWLTIRYGRQRAAEVTSLIAMPIGIAMAILGFAQANFMLGLVGVWVLFEAWQLRRLIKWGDVDQHPAFARQSEFDYMPDKARKPGFFARWRARRADKRARRDGQRAAVRREQVDAILEKVSREGIGSLTSHERRILDQASRGE